MRKSLPIQLHFQGNKERNNLFTFRTQIPDGDVLLHCGDVTLRSMKKEFVSFNKWIGSLPHPTKIVIAGNHDRLLEIRPLNSFFQTVSSKQNSIFICSD